MLIVVPRYGAYLITLTGLTLLFTNFLYYWLLPGRPLVIRMEDSLVTFNFGWSYWLVMVAGILCVITGGAVSIIDLIYPHKFSTILEVRVCVCARAVHRQIHLALVLFHSPGSESECNDKTRGRWALAVIFNYFLAKTNAIFCILYHMNLTGDGLY